MTRLFINKIFPREATGGIFNATFNVVTLILFNRKIIRIRTTTVKNGHKSV